jgi:type VI secretion system protein ImpH
LPGGTLHSDLLVLLRVYLGWRCNATLQLTVAVSRLPTPVLGNPHLRLGMTGVLGLGADTWSAKEQDTLTVNLGRYQGLSANPRNRKTQHVSYPF